MNTLNIPAWDLRRLLAPVMPLVSDDPNFPVLETVLLETRRGYVTATATDRFRAGMSRVPTGSVPDGFRVAVHISDLRAIEQVFAPKTASNPTLNLAIDENRLTVSSPGTERFVCATVTYAVETGQFPDVETLLRKALADDPVAVPSNVNSARLATFGDVGDGPDNAATVYSTGPSKPLVIVSERFVGALMPLKLVETGRQPAVDVWAEFLAPEEPSS